ncbi:unnamed protein product [Peniophora sp. CBMAI 1063]|nr:unnamed protein product [Peniophora sp. CBMAI 1063]
MRIHVITSLSTFDTERSVSSSSSSSPTVVALFAPPSTVPTLLWRIPHRAPGLLFVYAQQLAVADTCDPVLSRLCTLLMLPLGNTRDRGLSCRDVVEGEEYIR